MSTSPTRGTRPGGGSRERILARVRAALADVPAHEAPEDVAVPRAYTPAHGQGATVELLVDRLVDYRAQVHRAAPGELAERIGLALAHRRAQRVVVPADAPEEWFARTATTIVRDGGGLDVAELDGMDGVVTGCAVAIAETGTIVLDTGAAQGRRALTLIPDYHLCVVRADQIVDGVPQALPRLDPARPLTWISGPSATSDIELNRVEGVHGPRTLEVVIVE
ncbi:LutC/YkgG family protein [Streptomonospora nanhaiensis]|uniref:L-lactate dehydrogenase complex protein LldG n=1 Tax=Streptomonospora nanhaiensis TaxID=1323731 RepID=A0A853BHP5_9ACTN|nr:lactate utilization protein C [Streptomonospora nanhaiensis]MBV2364426.1 lactate utilization protein C [Streptomonospora nanhaiensis]NYI94056.1 L-lactate dehydrogenase complex protein LldG [Streptomonospora nanhaiensis]